MAVYWNNMWTEFTALRELPKLRDNSRFEPWLWSLAGNVTKSFRRFMRKQHAMYSYDALEDFSHYLYGIMALEHLSKKHNPVVLTGFPVRYDGFRWSYHAHLLTEQKHAIRGLGWEISANLGSRGTYQHNSWHFGGFSYRRMMFDTEINVCEDILCHREITDKDSAASAIQEGFVSRNRDGELTVLIPAFTKEQYEEFNVLAEKNFAQVIGWYSDSVAKYVAGYKKLFPAHLEEDVTRACHYMFLMVYATNICRTAQKKGLLAVPAQGSVCDVMIQFKKL